MPVEHSTFPSRLKDAVLGRRDRPLVFLGNFEVEEQWAQGERSLPRVSSPGNVAVVNRMDEFSLLVAGPDDHVVLKGAPDHRHLAHLRRLGLPTPSVHSVAKQDPQRTVTEDVLADTALLARLRELAAQGAALVPHGVSEVEENLAAATGLPLAAAPAAVCKAVNSKVYSRRLADELGLRQPTGWASTTVAEFDAMVDKAAVLLGAGRTVVLKEAFGVSGKGIAVIRQLRRLQRYREIIVAQAARSGVDHAAFVVEEWVGKRSDLNYQFTVARTGEVCFDFVKEALTEAGVHKGHRIPAELRPAQVDQLRDCAQLLGKRLADDGFFGVVGVDAMVDEQGELYPVIEINARHNMSTYQVALQEAVMRPGQVALARHYPMRLDTALPFAAFERELDGLLLTRSGGTGLVVTNFATVNANAGSVGPFDGRLYGFLVADSSARLQQLDTTIFTRLTRAEGAVR